jgi:hypothetical protein
MLLRIEVFPQAGKGGSAESDNPKPSQTLYASPATGANRRKLLDGDKGSGDDATVDGDTENDNDPNAGLVAIIGRKGDVDILFGADRSISRQHALLRFVAPRSVGAKQKGKRRRTTSTTRGKKADDDGNDGSNENENENETTAVPRGCFMEPRNEDERSACDDSPYGMCLVLESKGKSGSYIASIDVSVKEENDDDDDDDEHNDKKDGADDSDATTDDEGAAAIVVGATNDGSNSSQNNYGTATSLTTQLGEIILSRKNLSPSQKLPSLSGAVRHHFGSNTPVKLTNIGADESQVLEFGDYSRGDGDSSSSSSINNNNNSSNSNSNNSNSNDDPDASANPSILIQFGCALLPTIKITLIPMTVVFSSGVPSSIQNSLRLCGGLFQEAGTLPHRESNGNRNDRTTHLVAPERMAVAKQLIAWCYGIPIVSPDFLLALRDHSALKDPFPLPTDFPAKATDTNAFWDWTPDPNILSKYTMISVDPSPEVEQAEGLAKAAGAKLERLYDKQKKHTKAKVKIFLKHAKGLLEEAIDGTITTAPQQQQQQVVLLSSKAKSKWSNANTTLLLKQLKEELSIPSATSKILAKTITKQESELVGLESSNSNINSGNSSSGNSSSNNNNNKGRSEEKKIDPTITKETALADVGRSPAEKLDNGGSDDSQKERPTHKRERKEACAAEAMKMESQAYSGDGHCHDDEGSNEVEEIPSQSRSYSQSSKRRKVDHQEQQHQADYNPPSDDVEPVGSVVGSTSHKPHSTNTRKTNSSSSSNGRTEFGRADANGWFKAAPKDDRERSRWRQRASEANQKETGIKLESSASTNSGDPRIYVVATNENVIADVVNHRHRRQNNPNPPNFKKFRKNLLPRAIPSEEVVVLLDAALSQARQAPQEPSAEERQLQEHQKLAEALFKGDPVPGMVKKMRRVRK